MNKAIIMDRQENVPAGLSSPSQPIARHTLRIEDLGQKHCSGIRLRGQWLTHAEFPAGGRVEVTVISPGLMELRSVKPSATVQACGSQDSPLPCAPASQPRIFKIEDLGAPWPLMHHSSIRLRGDWLTHAGFPPGGCVAVTVMSPGFMQLRIDVSNLNSDFNAVCRETFALFNPLNRKARSWLGEHCPAGANHCYFGNALVVEARYVGNLLQHAEEDGLVVNPQP